MISSEHSIVTKSGVACGNGICSGGSQDRNFFFFADVYGPWILGGSPSTLKFLYGQSYLGYMPSDHPAFAFSAAYYQRPALYLKRNLHTEELRPYFQFHLN